jgi:two-component system nitrate/nitrite response regulator NarL
MIRVLIAHESPLFRAGLCSTLERHEDIYIVGQTIEREHLLELTTVTQPVVLFDGRFTSSLPDFRAAEIVAQVRRAGARGILVFAPSTVVNEEDLFYFLRSGAAAYELPSISGDCLVEKIRRIAQGEYLISSEVLLMQRTRPAWQEVPVIPCEQAVSVPDSNTGKLQGYRSRRPLDQVIDCLTAREIAILREIMKGRSNKQVAQALEVSDRTIKNHIASILQKLHVPDRTAAVVMALRHELISFDDINLDELYLDQEAFAQRAQRWVGSRVTRQQQVARPYAVAANT